MLARAGWEHVVFTRHDLPFYVGGPGTSPEDATAMGLAVGPLRPLLQDAPQSLVTVVADAVVADLAQCTDEHGIRLAGSIAIVRGAPLSSCEVPDRHRRRRALRRRDDARGRRHAGQ